MKLNQIFEMEEPQSAEGHAAEAELRKMFADLANDEWAVDIEVEPVVRRVRNIAGDMMSFFRVKLLVGSFDRPNGKHPMDDEHIELGVELMTRQLRSVFERTAMRTKTKPYRVLRVEGPKQDWVGNLLELYWDVYVA